LFTPQLINFYNQYHLSKKFDIVYISGDENEEQFQDYWKQMPWLALSFQEQESSVRESPFQSSIIN
jgi:nucleoredoxin